MMSTLDLRAPSTRSAGSTVTFVCMRWSAFGHSTSAKNSRGERTRRRVPQESQDLWLVAWGQPGGSTQDNQPARSTSRQARPFRRMVRESVRCPTAGRSDRALRAHRRIASDPAAVAESGMIRRVPDGQKEDAERWRAHRKATSREGIIVQPVIRQENDHRLVKHGAVCYVPVRHEVLDDIVQRCRQHVRVLVTVDEGSKCGPFAPPAGVRVDELRQIPGQVLGRRLTFDAVRSRKVEAEHVLQGISVRRVGALDHVGISHASILRFKCCVRCTPELIPYPRGRPISHGSDIPPWRQCPSCVQGCQVWTTVFTNCRVLSKRDEHHLVQELFRFGKCLLEQGAADGVNQEHQQIGHVFGRTSNSFVDHQPRGAGARITILPAHRYACCLRLGFDVASWLSSYVVHFQSIRKDVLLRSYLLDDESKIARSVIEIMSNFNRIFESYRINHFSQRGVFIRNCSENIKLKKKNQKLYFFEKSKRTHWFFFF